MVVCVCVCNTQMSDENKCPECGDADASTCPCAILRDAKCVTCECALTECVCSTAQPVFTDEQLEKFVARFDHGDELKDEDLDHLNDIVRQNAKTAQLGAIEHASGEAFEATYELRTGGARGEIEDDEFFTDPFTALQVRRFA